MQDAVSARGAMALLVDQQLDVQELKEKKSVLQFEITRKKLKQADLMHFCRQLAAFVRAGIPLVEALAVIEEEADDKTLRQVLADVAGIADRGGTRSPLRCQQFETMFPQFYIDMVRAAELTGQLDDVLDEMSRYIRRDMEARAQDQVGDHLPDHHPVRVDRDRRGARGLRAPPVQDLLRVVQRDAAAADADADLGHELLRSPVVR